MTTPERFWSLVDKGGDCWEWLGRRDEKGYGRVGFNSRPNVGAHRVSWTLTHGDPGEQFVLHRCDNPPCVNPDHLFLGTQADNNRDRHAKGRTGGFVGTRNRAKTSPEDIADMRDLRRSGMTQQDIADRFGLSRGNVAKIVKGALPKHSRGRSM